MERKPMTFGSFIREKRLKTSEELTLRDMSERLGISLSFLSDIEHGRKKSFEPDKIEIFAEIVNLTPEEKNLMYDLAARDTGAIPSDIENLMMYSEIGDIARFAMRKSVKGEITIEEWKKLIQEKEERD